MTRVLPKGWEEKTLGEVCSFNRGLTYKKSDEVSLSSNVVLRANNIDLSTNSLNFDELKYLSPNFEIPADKKVQKDCLLICTASGSKSHLGKVALIDKDYGYAFGGFMGLLLPDKFIDSHYLFYALTSKPYFDFVSHLTDGANINNLKWSQLQDFKLIIPPLPEQKRIVEKLDKIFANIDKAKSQTEKNLQNAKDVFSSYLNNIFNHPAHNWEEKKLGELCDVLDFRRKPITRKDRTRGLYPYYGATGIVDFIDSFLFDEPLLLVGEDGARWGSGEPCAFIASGKYWVNNHAHVLKPKNCMSMQYLVYFLNYSDLTPYITGTTVLKLNQQKLRSISVPSPSLPEQKRIVEKLDVLQSKTQELEKIYTQKLKDLEELKQAVLQQAFSGKL